MEEREKERKEEGEGTKGERKGAGKEGYIISL